MQNLCDKIYKQNKKWLKVDKREKFDFNILRSKLEVQKDSTELKLET